MLFDRVDNNGRHVRVVLTNIVLGGTCNMPKPNLGTEAEDEHGSDGGIPSLDP